jgi:DNA-binding NarL/FixJ family response regulator
MQEQTAERQASSALIARSRSIKFTPERLQQIKNLVERGKSREEIAEILDVTVGSLQVTCSKMGISLRRPKIINGVYLLKKPRPPS